MHELRQFLTKPLSDHLMVSARAHHDLSQTGIVAAGGIPTPRPNSAWHDPYRAAVVSQCVAGTQCHSAAMRPNNYFGLALHHHGGVVISAHDFDPFSLLKYCQNGMALKPQSL
jgi:hypothetical protein